MPTRRPQQPGAVASAAPGVNAPFMGLFLDRPPHVIEPSGFSACNNVRVRFNQIWFKDMGWIMQVQGNGGGGPLFIPSADTPSIYGGGLFTLSTQGWQYLIIVTGGGDIYAVAFTNPPSGFVNPTGTGNALFITPIYSAGTVSGGGGVNATITGSSTAWNTPIGTGFRNNVRVNDYIAFGGNNLVDPRINWYQVTSVNSDTSITLSGNIPFVPGGTNYTIRQRLSPNLNNSRVNMESFPNAGTPDNQDLLFIADGGGSQRGVGSVDPIVVWNPTINSATYLSGFSFSAKKLRRFSNVMIYADLWGVAGGSTPLGWLGATSMQSSDNGLPKSLATGVAFQGVVSDGAEPIQHLGVLGNQLLIYTGGQAPANINFSLSAGQGGSVISANFVGLPTVWQFSTVIRGRGTLGQGLVAEFADRHQFLSQDGEYRYNGMFLQVMNDHIFRQVVAALNYGSLQSAFNIIDPQAGEIMWVLPTSANAAINNGNIWACYVEHYMEQANNYLFKPVTIRDAASVPNGVFQWQCFLGSIPNQGCLSIGGRQGPLIGDSSGNVIQAGLAVGDQQTWGSSAAQNITETCTFAGRIIAGERARGLVKRIYPFVDEVDSTGNTVSVNLALSDRVGAAYSTTSTITYTTGTATRFVTPYRRGRVGQVTFTFISSPTTNLLLDGYDWDLPRGSPGGER